MCMPPMPAPPLDRVHPLVDVLDKLCCPDCAWASPVLLHMLYHLLANPEQVPRGLHGHRLDAQLAEKNQGNW